MKKEFITQPDESVIEISTWCHDYEKKSTGSGWYEAKDGGLVFIAWGKCAKTFDEGETATVTDAPEGMSSNIVRLKDGRLMTVLDEATEAPGYDFTIRTFYAGFSEDDGKTFSGKVVITDKARRLFLMNQRLTRLSSGRIILPMAVHPECLYDEKHETVGWAGAFWSDDEGQTWEEGEWKAPATVDQLCEPVICEMADGTLKMMVRTGRGHLYLMDSTDGGRTWSDEYATTLRSPCAPFIFAYDPFAEQYTVVWDNSFPGTHHLYPRTPICIGVSKDCRKWKTVCELGNEPNGSYGYPSITFTENAIMMGYYISNQRGFGKGNRVHMVKLMRDQSPLLAVKEK